MKQEPFNPEFYTKYEKARIIGARALQLSMNAPILLKISREELENLRYDPLKIAELEFSNGILPITVRRPLPQKAQRKDQEEEEEIEKIEKVEEEIEGKIEEKPVKKEKEVEGEVIPEIPEEAPEAEEAAPEAEAGE